MQPNITSTSGGRSEIPFRRAPLEDVRRELPEEIFIDSDYSCDDSTSARAVPITHHIKPRPSFVEARRHHKFRTFSNESIKSSSVSHRSNFPSSDTTESEHHEETCPIARSMPPALVPAIPIVPTENVDDIKEEEDEVIIYQPQGSTQSKSGMWWCLKIKLLFRKKSSKWQHWPQKRINGFALLYSSVLGFQTGVTYVVFCVFLWIPYLTTSFISL